MIDGAGTGDGVGAGAGIGAGDGALAQETDPTSSMTSNSPIINLFIRTSIYYTSLCYNAGEKKRLA